MTWPLLKPARGYIGLSRFESRSRRPSTSTSTNLLGVRASTNSDYLGLLGRLLARRAARPAARRARPGAPAPAVRLGLRRSALALGPLDARLERGHQVRDLLGLL